MSLTTLRIHVESVTLLERFRYGPRNDLLASTGSNRCHSWEHLFRPLEAQSVLATQWHVYVPTASRKLCIQAVKISFYRNMRAW
jgi:hypothetical protein